MRPPFFIIGAKTCRLPGETSLPIQRTTIVTSELVFRRDSPSLNLGVLTMKKTFLLALAASVALTTSASAASLLYRNDFSVGTDYMGAAISASTFSVTSTNGNLSSFTLGSYDVVVYANQNSGVPGGDLAALNAYILGGGKVIFADWTQSGGFNGGQSFTGNNNLNTITLGGQFNAGIVGPLAVVNPGWGTYSTGLGLLGGVSAGSFENGDNAIVVGNGGRTIVNGFLTDTVASQQLYTNELNFLSGAVPEPATWAMMIIGFGLVGTSLRGSRRRNVVTA